MRVDASSVQSPGWQHSSHKQEAATETRQVTQQASSKSASPKSAAPEVKQTASGQARAKGVIRLMQEGHFKGVAALRLRINFADQLSALEQGQQQEAARQGITDLSQAMSSQVDSLLGSGLIGEENLSQVQELSAGFIANLEQSSAENPFDREATADGLRQIFDAFDSALRDLLLNEPKEAPAVEVVEEQAVGTQAASEETPAVVAENEPAAEPAPANVVSPAEDNASQNELQSGLDALAATFDEQLGTLEERVVSVSLPPVPEAPDNQGGAYQKFLAVYQEMQGLAPASETPESVSEG